MSNLKNKNIEHYLLSGRGQIQVRHIKTASGTFSGRFFSLHRSSDGFFRYGIFPYKKTGIELIKRISNKIKSGCNVKNHNIRPESKGNTMQKIRTWQLLIA